MKLIAFIILAVVLTGIGYGFKRATLAIASAFAWLLLALYSYSQSTAVWDIYYCLFWLGIAAMLAIAIESVGMKIWATFGGERNEESKDETNHRKLEREETVVYVHPADRMRAKHGLPPSEIRARGKQARAIRRDTDEFYR